MKPPSSTTPERRELAALAEENRAYLPPAFFEELSAIETSLVLGQDPTEVMRGLSEKRRAKKRGAGAEYSPELRNALLTELSILLCTDDPKYAHVRGFGRQVTAPSVKAIAAIIAGATFGPVFGLVVGMAAFIGLAIGSIGVEAYCRLRPPPSKDGGAQAP
jgi:hypothetical protein